MSLGNPLDIEAWQRYLYGEYVPDRLPPGTESADEGPGGARLRAATALCLRSHGAVPPTQAREYTQFTDRRRRQEGRFAVGRIVRPLEQRALTEWAAGGHLLNGAEFTRRWLEQGQMGGAEHEGYYNPAANRWYKRNNLTYHSTYLEYFHRLALHNFLFPEAPVRLEGFISSDGMLMPVLSQFHVWMSRGASRAETEAAMLRLGLQRQRDDNYYHPVLGVLAEDLHDENVLIGEDGELFVIDPALYLDDRSKGKRLRMHAEGQP